jgi:outer membrane lipoprotein-sorting protein
LLLLSGLACACFASQALKAAPQSAAEARRIIDHVDRLMRGDSSQASVEMSVVTPDWQRQTLMTIWSQGVENVLIRVNQPKKEQGTATLRTGGNIWNYLPKIDRVIRVPTSMMMASWMGSHFTNDDLVKESRLIRDYNIMTTFEGVRDGTEVFEFLLTPKPEAPVVWGRIIYLVRKADEMPVWAKYYGEDGVLKRTATFTNYMTLGGRLVPARVRMTPQDKPGSYTELHYLSLQFDVAIPAETFSLNALKGPQ